MTLRNKLLALYVFSTVAILFALGGIFYGRIWEQRLQAIRQDMSHELQHVDFALNAFFIDVESDVRALAANKAVRWRDDRSFTNFLDADEKTFQYRIGPHEQAIIDVFNNYLKTHSYVGSVYMGRENGSFVRSHKRERPTRYDPRQRPWYVLAKNNPREVLKTDAYPALTTNDVNIGITHALVDERGVFFGVMGVDVTLLKLTNYIANIQINPAGRIVLLDKNGLVLAGLKEMLFKNIDLYSPDLRRGLKDPHDSYVAVDVQGRKNYVFHHNFSKLDWIIVALIPEENIEKEIIGQIVTVITALSIGLI